MKDQKTLARQALRGALEIRNRSGVSKSEPICIYDLAERLGVEVRFVGGNSFGGMYSKTSHIILVPTLRPRGRQAFTCGHELGHWHFGHGNRIDHLHTVEKGLHSDPEELLADMFSGYLLMPPWAVKEAFGKRNWDPAACTPLQAYIVSAQLGVGYESLVHHLRWSIHFISQTQAEMLIKKTPKQLRRSILRRDTSQYLVIADKAWSHVPIDLQVGDIAILPEDVTLEGRNVDVAASHELGLLIYARAAGISRAESSDGQWAAFIRVSRKDFQGRCKFRHLEDYDVD